MNLADLFPITDLQDMLDARYVKMQAHPTEPLIILNYTDKAMFDNEWNPVTRACRGLIYNLLTGEVVARPFPKFFNYGDEQNAPAVDLDAPARVTDKVDGSLGIIYREPVSGLLSVATRGSFTSDQARHATELLRHPDEFFNPWPGVTYLVEIVYPENRIVLDYGKRDTLILLDVIAIETGRSVMHRDWGWPGPVVDHMDAGTLREALAIRPRPNAEGLVVTMEDGATRLKIKQQDYLKLHKLIFGMTERVIWQRLGEGMTVADLCEGLPDEFHPWVKDVAQRLYDEVEEIWMRTVEACSDYPIEDRKEFALAIRDHPLRHFMFLMKDGQTRRLGAAIWSRIKPAHQPMTHQSEDVA